jgi:flagellar FliL protein
MAKAAEDSIEDSIDGAKETANPPAKTGGPAHRRLALIVAGALVALAALAAGAYASGFLDKLLGPSDGTDDHAEAQVASPPVFYALPDLLVSLNTGERRSTFLKVRISLQLQNAEDQPRIERLLPRLIDYCQVYLRELRLDELRGSAGTTRLREELLRRISAAVAPVQVTDVLFGEIFVQ